MTVYITPFGRLAMRRAWGRMADENEWPGAMESEVSFPVDVKAEPEAFVITALLPGVKAEDLNIQIVNETVSIQGEFKDERDEKDTYLLSERPSGRFSRVLSLPAQLDPATAEAHAENGVLTLRVPKAETARPKAIKVVAK